MTHYLCFHQGCCTILVVYRFLSFFMTHYLAVFRVIYWLILLVCPFLFFFHDTLLVLLFRVLHYSSGASIPFLFSFRIICAVFRVVYWLILLVQPVADRVALNLEMISKNFQFSTKRTRSLMGFITYHLVLIVNSMVRILVRWVIFQNNLEFQCHPICIRLYNCVLRWYYCVLRYMGWLQLVGSIKS